MLEPTIYELSSSGRSGVKYPDPDVPLAKLPEGMVRKELPLPELSEFDVVRHFTRLSRLNYCIDTGFYPLGSCTMKYNPKVNEQMAALDGFARAPPLQGEQYAQGCLEVLFRAEQILKEVTGMAAVTFQPAQGAHGDETFAHHWMHNGFLNIENAKMSTSLGNFFTVRDILKEYEPEDVRMLMLSAHYRSPLNFSREMMAQARASLTRLYTALERVRELAQTCQMKDMAQADLDVLEQVEAARETFRRGMNNDFNTAEAMGALFDLALSLIHISEPTRPY